MSTVYDWSLNAAVNANADDIVNWSEGQPPSSVNNSARAMMQRISEYISDRKIIIAKGTQNAIQGSISSQIKDYIDGMTVNVTAVSTNTGETTIALNGLEAKPIYKMTYKSTEMLSGGEIKKDVTYIFLYSEKLQSGSGGWLLTTPSPQISQPTGMIAPFAMATPPSGWLECNGDAVSREKYSDLYSAIGEIWGKGNGVNTFNLPDFRGYFLRGWDHGRGIDSGRAFAKKQDSQNLKHEHGAKSSVDGHHGHNYDGINIIPGPGSSGGWGAPASATKTTTLGGDHSHTITISPSGGDEARPVNMSILYAIKV